MDYFRVLWTSVSLIRVIVLVVTGVMACRVVGGRGAVLMAVGRCLSWRVAGMIRRSELLREVRADG